jgi:hypothetical protein
MNVGCEQSAGNGLDPEKHPLPRFQKQARAAKGPAMHKQAGCNVFWIIGDDIAVPRPIVVAFN